jgi:UDP-3-O-[3-hydroxymyristoyl] N-acetylglucosamine deacetylase/3-hydroxyacyl-[acyl-carrier-protein] dehydratase
MASDRQHTLAKSVSMTGTSLHTGEQVTLTLQPAPENFGFKFRRIDLEDKPFIPRWSRKVQKVERATTIAEGGVNVHTVEHVISALAAWAWTTPSSRWMPTSRPSPTAARCPTSS